MIGQFHPMPCRTFINLTTPDADERARIISGARPYNPDDDEGRPPYLILSRYGTIVSFDGRKRAAAMIKSGIDRMPVFVRIIN